MNETLEKKIWQFLVQQAFPEGRVRRHSELKANYIDHLKFEYYFILCDMHVGMLVDNKLIDPLENNRGTVYLPTDVGKNYVSGVARSRVADIGEVIQLSKEQQVVLDIINHRKEDSVWYTILNDFVAFMRQDIHIKEEAETTFEETIQSLINQGNIRPRYSPDPLYELVKEPE